MKRNSIQLLHTVTLVVGFMVRVILSGLINEAGIFYQERMNRKLETIYPTSKIKNG